MRLFRCHGSNGRKQHFLLSMSSREHKVISPPYGCLFDYILFPIFFFRNNVWARCPAGYYLNGLRLGTGPPQYLLNIDEAKCCHPQDHPNSYKRCYNEDVSLSFDNKGWSECKRPGYYMVGFYKSSCNDINCIEKFKCCQMKKGTFNLLDLLLNQRSTVD